MPLPRSFPRAGDRLLREWQRLLAEVMPFDLVIDEETSWGEEVRVSQTSVCGSWGPIAGDLRYFSDRFGRTRGSIEGTQLPFDLIWRNAEVTEGELVYDPGQRRAPLRLRKTRMYHGFELESEDEGIDAFPAGREEEARRILAEAMSAGAAYHRDVRPNRGVFRELREVHRRSGGETREVTESALAEDFRRRLGGVGSYSQFMETPLAIQPDDWASAEERKRWLALPGSVTLRGEEYPLDYFVEDGASLVRARIPEKVLWEIQESDVPALDRPLRWTVLRGKRDAVRADTLEEARELAAKPRVELRREGRLVRDEPAGGGGRGPQGGAARGGSQGSGRSGRSGKSEKSESRGRRRRDRGRGGRR
jgi:hypothetical protein